MVEEVERETNGNGKKTLKLELKRKTFDKVEKLSEKRDETPEKWIVGSIYDRIHHAEVFKVIEEGCLDGRISENSKACKAIARKEEISHHSL